MGEEHEATLTTYREVLPPRHEAATVEITRQQRRMAERDMGHLLRGLSDIAGDLVRDAISPGLMAKYGKGARGGELKGWWDIERDIYCLSASLELEDETVAGATAQITAEALQAEPGVMLTEALRRLAHELLRLAEAHYHKAQSPIYSEYDHEAGF